MAYVVLQRHGVADWLATVAALPVLFDPGQLMLEQLIMSDMLGLFLMMASLTVLLVRRMPSIPRSAVAGVLMALSALVRPTVLPLIILVPLFLGGTAGMAPGRRRVARRVLCPWWRTGCGSTPSGARSA